MCITRFHGNVPVISTVYKVHLIPNFHEQLSQVMMKYLHICSCSCDDGSLFLCSESVLRSLTSEESTSEVEASSDQVSTG